MPLEQTTTGKALERAEARIEQLKRVRNAHGRMVAFRDATDAERDNPHVKTYNQPSGHKVALATLTDEQRTAGLITLAEFRVWADGQHRIDSIAAQNAKRPLREVLALTEGLPAHPEDHDAPDPRSVRFNEIKRRVRDMGNAELESFATAGQSGIM